MTRNQLHWATRTAFGLAVIGSVQSAFAGSLNANIGFAFGQAVNFTSTAYGTFSGQNTVQFQGVRTGGTDTLVPNTFNCYCVELNEHIGGGGNAWPDVVPLLNSTTNTGGVVFDAVRTSNLQKLWGNAFAQIGTDANKSAAFQLAEWEICFDNDLTLDAGTGNLFYVTPGQFQAGITDQAETWLNNIKIGEWSSEQQLVLLTGRGIQDLVTPVPEPASLAVIGVGALGLLRRRSKK